MNLKAATSSVKCAHWVAARRYRAATQKNCIDTENVTYHPQREKTCEEILEYPLMRTPPPEPTVPPPPRERRARQFKFPPKFALLTDEFYNYWCNHRKQVIIEEHRVDDSPPTLFPELYLQPRRLDTYAKIIEANMKVNQDLLKRINLIQRNGGYVDCHNVSNVAKINQLMCEQRQRILDEIMKCNYAMYHRLCKAKSPQPSCKELNRMWQSTKHKLILGAQRKQIHFVAKKAIRYRRFDLKLSYAGEIITKNSGYLSSYSSMRQCKARIPIQLLRMVPQTDRYGGFLWAEASSLCDRKGAVTMEIVVRGGAKIGYVTIELFNDIAPQATKLFLNLVKGDYRGYAYTGTKIFRSVPELYCRGGDVVFDNGFGQYVPEDAEEPLVPEDFILDHTVPGVLSMAVTKEGELSGQFNIVFKPLPQFDGKHVVFGRVKTGPAQFLERISALGLALGPTTCDIIIRKCGYYSRNGQYHEGAPNTIKFPTRAGN